MDATVFKRLSPGRRIHRNVVPQSMVYHCPAVYLSLARAVVQLVTTDDGLAGT
jgi:hypothetical protein